MVQLSFSKLSFVALALVAQEATAHIAFWYVKLASANLSVQIAKLDDFNQAPRHVRMGCKQHQPERCSDPSGGYDL